MNFWRRWRKKRQRRRVAMMIDQAERIRDESYRRYKRARKLLKQLYKQRSNQR